MIPLAEAEGLAVCPYQVFEGGLLTGKYSSVSAGEGLPAVSLVLLTPDNVAGYSEPAKPGLC